MKPEEIFLFFSPLIVLMPLILVAVIIAIRQRGPSIDGTSADGDDGTCVACGSTDLVVGDGGDTFCCRACGYEGGKGHAKLALETLKARAEAMSPEERRAAARRALDDAASLLKHAAQSLRSGAKADLVAHLPNGGWITEADNQEATAVTEQGNILQAADAIRRARILLGISAPMELDVDIERRDDAAAVVRGALTFPGTNNDLTDLADRADQLRHQALELLRKHVDGSKAPPRS